MRGFTPYAVPGFLVAAGLCGLLGAAGASAEEPGGGGSPPGGVQAGDSLRAPGASLILPGEDHFQSLQQLTFGGENAEAYFSPDGSQIVFQSTRPPFACDQIFRMATAGGDPVPVSTGRGRTTCAYFLPDGVSILYASTHQADPGCPTPPDMSQGYVWGLFPGYDIFVLGPPHQEPIRITNTPGYDAEATVSPTGDRIVFTSLRGGDIDLWSMNLDGSDARQLTHGEGYDGGAFFSPDGKEIVYRAYYPPEGKELDDYRRLKEQSLVRPGKLNLYIMNADGSSPRLVFENGAANFAPYFHPDGERIIFASNLDDPKGRNFDLYLIHRDGTGLLRVTDNPTFDGFPMFSPDGARLVFASNRNNRAPHDTNIFLAVWKD